MFIVVQVRNSTQLPGATFSAGVGFIFKIFYLPGQMIQFYAHIFQMGGLLIHQLYHILAMEIGNQTDLMINESRG